MAVEDTKLGMMALETALRVGSYIQIFLWRGTS